MFRARINEMTVEVDEKRCSGCGRCFSLCNYNVFERCERTGCAVAKNPERCAGCGKCIEYCPQQAIVMNG